jgi:D-alanyl-D-alanine carboxypeptidase/D-alanyl-D-alanine-endopeptidase (penicillin-binding protein 4)
MKRSNLLKWWAKMALLLLPIAGFSQLNSEKTSTAFDEFIADPDFQSTSIGLTIVNAKTRHEVFNYNGKKSLIPASSLKMVTATTVMELFGGDHAFSTKLTLEGEIENEILEGNFVVTGGGDPTLGHPELGISAQDFIDECVEAAITQGIHTINGDILCQDHFFSGPTVAQSVSIDNSGNYYAAGSTGLHWRGNSFAIKLSSEPLDGGSTRIVDVNPNPVGIEIVNEVTASNVNHDLAYIHSIPGSNQMIIRGTIPKGKTSFTIHGALHDPAKTLRRELIQAFAQNGIRVSQNEVFSESKKELGSIEGDPLREIVRYTLFESDNSMADCLLKHIGKRYKDDGSFKGGVNSLQAFWRERGVNTKGWFQCDGSGLSRSNGITTQQLALIIAKGREDNIPHLKAGMKHLGNIKNVWSKSGYIDRVRAYAGFIEVDGNRYVYSIMANNYDCSASAMRKKIEKLFRAVAG